MANGDSLGVEGSYGPNDSGYINSIVRDVAKGLRSASELWSFGYGYKCEQMPDSHPIARALAALAEADRETARFANREPDPSLFLPVQVSAEMVAEFKASWERAPVDGPDGCPGVDGVIGCG